MILKKKLMTLLRLLPNDRDTTFEAQIFARRLVGVTMIDGSSFNLDSENTLATGTFAKITSESVLFQLDTGGSFEMSIESLVDILSPQIAGKMYQYFTSKNVSQVQREKAEINATKYPNWGSFR